MSNGFALIMRLLPSPVGRLPKLNTTAPSVQRHYSTFNPTTDCSAPVPRIDTQGLAGLSTISDLSDAIRYAIRHWPGLVVFLDDGRVEMDTNVVERAIRPHTITRKNALFAGSDGGARHWAIAMTLIKTAKLNGVNPMAWLTDVHERVVSGETKANELHQLLPWNWAPSSALTIAPKAA